MKVAERDVKFFSRGVQEKREYTVSQSAAIMNLLADSLYNDKVAAPIRELSTNALDGHTVAGNKETPFDVYLPTYDNLEFKIRDYGCGMTYEQLSTMYTEYGNSDKTHSNDFNGCMGIGSKSPFAYAASFTTTSYRNGKMCQCVNAKNRAGLPELSFFTVNAPTTEPDGIEITFSVKREDVYKFKNAAERIYRYFPTMPNIKRGTCDIEPLSYVFEGDNWKIYSDTEGSYAVMGYVAYPIESKHFQDDKGEKFTNRWDRYGSTPESMVLDLGIELNFEIGEVEMSASREGLQYTKRTIEAIKKRLANILDFIKEEIDKQFVECETLWDARMKYKDFNNGKMNKLKRATAAQKAEFDGVDLSQAVNIRSGNIPGCRVIELRHRNRTSYYGRGSSDIIKEDWPYSVEVPVTAQANTVQFYEKDMKNGHIAACRRVFDADQELKRIYLVSFNDDTARDTFIKHVGIKPSLLKKVSSVPRVKNSPKGKVKRENVFTLDLDRIKARTTISSNARFAKDWWNKAEVDIDDGGIFLELNSFKCRDSKGVEYNSSSVAQVCKALVNLGVDIDDVYGIKTAVVSKYRKHKEWQDFFEWAEEKTKEIIDNKGIADKYADVTEFNKFRNTRKYNEVVKNLDSTSDLFKFKEMIDEMEKEHDKHHKDCYEVTTITDVLPIDNTIGKPKYNLEEEEDKIIEKYPMIELFDAWSLSYGDTSRTVSDYVKFVDSHS